MTVRKWENIIGNELIYASLHSNMGEGGIQREIPSARVDSRNEFYGRVRVNWSLGILILNHELIINKTYL